MQVELFRPENVPLETEEAKLSQQYQKLSGSLTVQFRGEEKTLVQMGRYLEEPDRALRQEAWELVANRRLQEADKFEDIFDELVKLRAADRAETPGFKITVDYAFRSRGRFDYTPEDCLQFHDAVEKEIMPVVRELQAERRGQLEIGDAAAVGSGRGSAESPAAAAVREGRTTWFRARRRFSTSSTRRSAADFSRCRTCACSTWPIARARRRAVINPRWPKRALPFIFMNAVGVQRDVETMLHEAGHAFHALATRGEDLYAYRGAPIEFCEVASMSMELLGNEFLEEFYAAPEANRARRDHLEGIVEIFPVDRDGGCVSALDLHASRPHAAPNAARRGRN